MSWSLAFWASLVVALPVSGATGTSSQAGNSKTSDANGEKIEPDKLRADFRLARQALEEGHSGIYRYTPKEELDRLFDRTEQSLTKPMDVLEFYRLLAPVVAAVKCGHTGVLPPGDLMKAITTKTRLFPQQVRVLRGKVYVLRDLSGGPASLAGREIRSINGVQAAALIEKLVAAAPGDGDVQTSRMRRIDGSNFAVQLETLIGIHSPFTVTVWDPNEKREAEVQLEGVELPRLQDAARAKYPQDQRPTVAGEFQLLDEGKVGLLKIHQFGGFVDAERKKTLKELYKEAFGAMQEKGTKALILDLRNNGGGADELGKLLLSYLVDRPFQYYDDLVINAREFSFQKYTNHPEPLPENLLERQPNGKYRMVKHPNWGIQQPSTPTFAGKVLILINGVSFSTTSEFMSQAHFHKRATFIGEESGGAYYGNTSGPQLLVTLPHTKVRLSVPLMTYHMAVKGYKDAARGIRPDYPVEYTIEELLEGKDKEMAVALELARKP
jgi:C-terminal processing protease CtpA/Prc